MSKIKKKKMKTKVKVILVLTIIISIFGLGYLGINAFVDNTLNKTERTEKIKVEDAGISEEVQKSKKATKVVNIALFGTDNDGNYSDTDRSDAIKVISLNFDDKVINITSIQRDTLVYMPDPHNDWSKLNHAYWFGGPTLAIKTINTNFDLDITKYATFSFKASEKLVDLVGGVNIDLKGQEILQRDKPLGIYGEEGVYTLNGKQAMNYSRIRYIDDDFYRMERQNKVIKEIVRKLKTKSPLEILDIVNEMLPYVETNITNNEIKTYLTSLLSFDLNNITQNSIPSDGVASSEVISYQGYGPIYVPKNFEKLVKEVHLHIYNDDDYQVSSTLLELEKKTYEYFGFTKQE
ncbi:MAG: LCP family protein [Erysipelotrichaceae bacterium]|nr:LCP family protein [Erysipelotrichaceae bacterium]